MEIGGSTLQTQVMDHHGLVAAVCSDLGIATRIDNRLNIKRDPRRIVSAGTAQIKQVFQKR